MPPQAVTSRYVGRSERFDTWSQISRAPWSRRDSSGAACAAPGTEREGPGRGMPFRVSVSNRKTDTARRPPGRSKGEAEGATPRGRFRGWFRGGYPKGLSEGRSGGGVPTEVPVFGRCPMLADDPAGRLSQGGPRDGKGGFVRMTCWLPEHADMVRIPQVGLKMLKIRR